MDNVNEIYVYATGTCSQHIESINKCRSNEKLNSSSN